MVMNLSGQHIISLYRTYIRQVRALPHVYLRHFFRIKGADDFRSVLKTKSVELRRKKLNRVSKDLRRLRAANGGVSASFDRMLDIAYGRVGKLRWELMEPLLLDPSAQPQTSHRKEKISSPVYSPELATLLTSGISRTTKALRGHHLTSPPGLLRHAQSNSADIMLSGRSSRRREYNLRWSFFRSEWKKVYPPLQVSLQQPGNHTSTRTLPSHIFDHAFENPHSLQELLSLAGSPSGLPDPTGKQRRLQRIHKKVDTSPFDGNLPLRWLRRRYQALLSRLPLLISRPLLQNNSKRTYDVQLADSAMSSPKPHPPRLRAVDVDEVPWISDIRLTTRSGRRRT